MKGDFSRDTFDKTKHFSRVLMQQGRVQLDADFNEQTASLLHYLRTLAADFVGPFAGPSGADYGFEIGDVDVEQKDFTIGAGRYYVDGILCENVQKREEEVTYMSQDDFPNPPALDLATTYLVYLDVWERHITALEDDDIREKALGGPDTATRAQIVWQVKIEDASNNPPTDPDPGSIRTNWKKWVERWQPPYLGCLKARVKRHEGSNDPCLVAPDAKYRGAENHLYRVEIHRTGVAETATFKWSRDNGWIVTACERNGTELTVLNPRGFAANQWVELTNDAQELRGEYGTLVKLLKVEGDLLTLESVPSPSSSIPPGETWPTKVRRWDQSENGGLKLNEGAVVVVEATDTDPHWIDLEDGIQIQFLPAEGTSNENEKNLYRTGDYWLIPARVATGDIEWPVDIKNGDRIPLPKPPDGVLHHFAPLAVLVPNNPPDDARCQFLPRNTCGLSYSYGEEGIGGHFSCDPSPSSDA